MTKKVLQGGAHVLEPAQEDAVHVGDEVLLLGEAGRELGHGQVGLLEEKPRLGHGAHDVLKPVNVVEHKDKVVELGVDRNGCVGLGGAAHVHASLGLGVREAARGQALHHPYRGVHRGHDLRAHAGEGGPERPHPLHDGVDLSNLRSDLAHGRVDLERPRLLVLRALEDVPLVRPVPANHVAGLAQNVVLKLPWRDDDGRRGVVCCNAAFTATITTTLIDTGTTHWDGFVTEPQHAWEASAGLFLYYPPSPSPGSSSSS